MPRQECPHCNKSKNELSKVEVRVAGNILTVSVCDKCAENLGKIATYASTFPSTTAVASAPAPRKRGRPPKLKVLDAQAPEQEKKFESFALSPEEIAKTQALRPTVRFSDSPKKRNLDALDRPRATVYCMSGSPKMSAGRNRKIVREAQAKLGTDNIKCLKDDGFEAVFEAA